MIRGQASKADLCLPLTLCFFSVSLVQLSSSVAVGASPRLPPSQRARQRPRLWSGQSPSQAALLRDRDGRHVLPARPHPFLPGLLFLRVFDIVGAQRLRLPQRQHRGAQATAQDSRKPRPQTDALPLRPLPSRAERTLGFGVHSGVGFRDSLRGTAAIPLHRGQQHDHNRSLPQSREESHLITPLLTTVPLRRCRFKTLKPDKPPTSIQTNVTNVSKLIFPFFCRLSYRALPEAGAVVGAAAAASQHIRGSREKPNNNRSK